MKKFVLSIAAGILTGAATAFPLHEDEGHYKHVSPYFNYLPPTYLDDVYVDEGWKSNWFFTAQGGFSAFLGSPVGCGDFFDRTKPMLNVTVGKWLSPQIGGRVAFQGFNLVDAQRQSRKYQNYHVDFLYNASSHFRNDKEALPTWDCIPYIGVGFIRNGDTDKKPFAVSYGIIGRYRVATRWHVSAELGMTTTSQYFDGWGKHNKHGDHLLQANVGLTVTLGKVGWGRVIDPMPYIYQNDQMLHYFASEQEAAHDEQKLKERKMVMDMGDTTYQKYPKNNYSGLNSLRQRLKYRNQLATTDVGEDDDVRYVLDENKDDSLGFVARYLKAIQESEDHSGEPIFFYFNLNSTILTKESQEINVAQIANLIMENDLHVSIIGAADSQTGSVELNKKLGLRRAKYISKLLQQHGVERKRMALYNAGGIDTYSPFTANRNAKLTIYGQSGR